MGNWALGIGNRALGKVGQSRALVIILSHAPVSPLQIPITPSGSLLAGTRETRSAALFLTITDSPLPIPHYRFPIPDSPFLKFVFDLPWFFPMTL
ncbi:hypothetical protein NIES4075_35800 [Tolypothrix sp. NIES-4075]|uniref:hypothetical protein n=1 Tax=Tolypothrix sp. NIES-4075 TaxID=2005459 RepID=UPI000B6D5499|nr:hypothetical protein [Tolypothrix sp. NIES-4075]GAX42578.1 hypothetical protein NIES4075_35800 [Tolypothrix sp. NIES-4075]